MCRLAVAQKATVTFYSPSDPLSHQVKEGVSWWGTSPFRGFIFNGNKQLAHLSAGNFITFEFPVGKYIFSATPHKSPTDKYTINIEANAGEHYLCSTRDEMEGRYSCLLCRSTVGNGRLCDSNERKHRDEPARSRARVEGFSNLRSSDGFLALLPLNAWLHFAIATRFPFWDRASWYCWVSLATLPATAKLSPSFHSYLLDEHKFARSRGPVRVIWVEIRYPRKTKKRRRLENSKWLMIVLAR